ncbi:MAG: hypothetical protein Q9214_000295 [Letrouitia sp. 1 TL-2023]
MAENFIAEAFSLLAIALVAIGLRLYIRVLTVGFRKLALDDYLMIWAGVSALMLESWRNRLTDVVPVLGRNRACMIWKSRLAMKKKWVLSIMFSGGILIIVAGILRCVLILTAGANGPALAGEWSIRESFIAVMVNNLPMLYTLYQRIAQSDLFNQSRNLSGKSSGRGSYPLGSYRTGESGKASKKGKKFQHPLSMPNDTAMGSDERIVVNPNDPHAPGGYGPPAGEKPAQPGPYTTNIEDERNKAGSRGITVQTELSVHSTNEDQAPVGNGHSYSHFPPPV